MLSLDRQRKRKYIHRQRSRLISPVFETIPHSVPVEQLPFPDNVYLPPYGSLSHTVPSMYGGRPYMAPPPSPPVSSFGHLPLSRMGVHGAQETGALSPVRIGYKKVDEQHTEKISALAAKNVASLRPPVVILGSGKRCAKRGGVCPPGGRRMVVHSAISSLLLFIVVGATLAMGPVANDDRSDASGSFPPLFSMVTSPRHDIALIMAQNATATAVTVDGYDPGGATFPGVPSAPHNLHVRPMDYGNMGRFFYGQCTYWANMRYHQLTGHWVPWLGNAYQWAYEAPAYGWTIARTPNPRGHSIMVFSPYARGSSPYGHVAVVERVNPDGSVLTSNWNWNGMWATQSWLIFYPGSDVHFIWYPG